MSRLPYDVFISYTTEDECYAKSLVNDIKFHGFSVWFAPLSLGLGDRLLDSINAGLNSSSYGLLLLSPAYIKKKWTAYELDVLHRQHIENGKRLISVWHNISKSDLDQWNPGLSGIVGVKTGSNKEDLLKRIVCALSQNAPLRGVSPSWEDPHWRFRQGIGEMRANTENGSVFSIYDAAEFEDYLFPMYLNGKLYSRGELFIDLALVLGHTPEQAIMRIGKRRFKKLLKMCKDNGADPNDLC